MPFIIDRDLIADPAARPGTNANAAGVRGPAGYAGDGSELTHRFRLRDDDGEVYYEGRSHSDYSFAPLHCFGGPNAGCTEIQYLEGGTWATL